MDNDVHSLPTDIGAEVEKQPLDLRGKTVAEIASILTSPPIGRDYGIDEPLAHAPPVAAAPSRAAPDVSNLANAAPVTPTAASIAGPKQHLDLRDKSVAEIVSILTSPPVGRDYGIDEPLADVPPVAPASSRAAPDVSNLANAAPVTPTAASIAGPKQHLDLRDKSVAEIVSILTSPPVGRDYGIDEPLAHVPPVAPASSPVAPDPSKLANALPAMPHIANAPPMAPGSAGPNLDLKSRPAEGKIAFEDLRTSRPLHDQGPLVARFGRLSFVAILAGIIAIGATLITFSNQVREHLGDIFGMVAPRFEDPSQARTPTKLPRLVIKAQKGFVNEPLSLGVSINDASGQETVVLAGLASGTTLSTGTPLGFTSWRMLARDVGNAFVYAPKDFVGVMVAAIDLRLPSNWIIESQTVRLEWSQRQSGRRP
jgi:hypothetical protein